MTGTQNFGQLLIVLGSGILVWYENADRGSGGFSLENTTYHLGLVFLIPGGNHTALPRASSVQLFLDAANINWNSRAYAVDHHSDEWTVTFTKCHHTKFRSE